ncbi:MAG: hypothetical protein J7L12_02260, partial [Desulfurococcales archaeon]|nr:hypothetical protein [Desulfurococcales archaeon]
MKLKFLLSLIVAVIVVSSSILYGMGTALINPVESSTSASSQHMVLSSLQPPLINLTVTASTTEGEAWIVTPRTREVIEVLEPCVSEAIIKLLNCSDSARVVHTATFTEGDTNYTVLVIAEPGSNVTATYYVSWRSVGGFEVLDCGEVGFEVVARGG